MLKPKVILAPTDFSPAATDALETAADLASRYGAKLVVVHAVPAIPRLPAHVSIFKEADYERSLHDEASRRVAEIAAARGKAGISVQTQVGVSNDVGMEILRMAEHHQADLIVTATHGMTGWKELAFGSVAEKVVRMATCSVLVVRAPR